MPSKVKHPRLVISPERERLWLKRMTDCSNEMYNRLKGQLLTTLEVALPGGRQLEALKERVKDVQGEVWDSLNQTGHSMFCHWFSVSDEEQDLSKEEYQARAVQFGQLLGKNIAGKFERFKETIENLVIIAMAEHERQEALKFEVGRIVSLSSMELRGWINHAFEDVLKSPEQTGKREPKEG